MNSEHVNPFLDLLNSVRLVVISFFTLARSLARATIALLRLTREWGAQIAPQATTMFSLFIKWSIDILLKLGRGFYECSYQCKILCFVVFLLTTGWITGVFRTISRLAQQQFSKAKNCFFFHWRKFAFAVSHAYSFVTEVFITTMPAVTVIFPLRIYTTRVFFRRFFTLTCFATPLFGSCKAILDYHRHLPAATPMSAPISISKRGGRFSLFTMFSPTEEGAHVVRAKKRKTVEPSLIRGSLFDPPEDSASFRMGIRDGTSSRMFAREVQSVTLWLDFWIVATFLDFAVLLPLLVCHNIFGVDATALKAATFGVVDEGYADMASIALPWRNRVQPNSWASNAAGFCSAGLSFLYDISYTMLLIFVIRQRRAMIIAVRHSFVSFFNAVMVTLIGVQPIGSIGSPVNRHIPHEANMGLLPAIWKSVRSHLPPGVSVILDLVGHLPQVLLVFVPGFLLPVVVPIVALVYPVLGSLKALENGDSGRQVYWLTYFTLYSTSQCLFFRWIKRTLVWQRIFFAYHMELLIVTTLQALSVSPQWIADVVVPRVLAAAEVRVPVENERLEPSSTSESPGEALAPPGAGSSRGTISSRLTSPDYAQSADTVPSVKSEPESDDDVRRRLPRKERGRVRSAGGAATAGSIRQRSSPTVTERFPSAAFPHATIFTHPNSVDDDGDEVREKARNFRRMHSVPEVGGENLRSPVSHSAAIRCERRPEPQPSRPRPHRRRRALG